MKKLILAILLLSLASVSFAAVGMQSSHITNRQAGTIMISGAGTFRTDLDADLRRSVLGLNSDIALFLAPVLAVGVDLGLTRDFQEFGNLDEPSEYRATDLHLGPRAYFFFGGKTSELTPFIKGGANFLRQREYIDDELERERKSELGLTASAGVLLNLAKNVGISVEAEYNFEKGSDVDEIDTKQLFLKFGIRSFLGE